MNYIPMKYRCLIKIEPVADKTPGGIILTDRSKQDVRVQIGRALVVAIGGNAFENYIGDTPAVGDSVLVDVYQASKIPGEDDLYVINDDDIGVIIDEGEVK